MVRKLKAQELNHASEASLTSSEHPKNTSEQQGAEIKGLKLGRRFRLLAILGSLGPGLLTALAGNDAGGVATFASAGSIYGFGQLWTIPIMCLLLIVVQETAARMGCVTGKGFSSLIRERFGIRKSTFVMLALLITNTTVTLSEFAGIAAGMELFDVPAYISVPVFAVITWLLTMGGSYKRIEKILLAIACIFLTYIVAGVMAGPDWNEAFRSTITPAIPPDPAYVSLMVASIGTTISPYMMFMVQSSVVDKNLGPESLNLERVDTVVGTTVAMIITWFIILTTATVLFPAGVVVESAEDAARALVPLAGDQSAILFALGLIGASFLAACVLPGITAGAVCEVFGWERGADRDWGEAPAYRIIMTAIIVFSAAVILIPGISLFGIMLVAQVVNGILLPILLVCMVRIASDKRLMGKHANSALWNGLTWFTIIAISILTVVMFVLQAMGY